MNTSPVATPRPYLRTPAVSPDGTTVAFVFGGDIWIAPATGGEASRLVLAAESPRFSPDGATLVYTVTRSATPGIFALPLDGGMARQICLHGMPGTPQDFSPDGAWLFLATDRERQGQAIYRVPAHGGTPVLWMAEPYEDLDHLSFSPDGRHAALNVVRAPWYRRGPLGTLAPEIWLVDADGRPESARRPRPPAGRWPLWAPDGAGLYAVVDQHGVENLWYLPFEGDAHPLTDFSTGRVLFPTIARTGGLIVFEHDLQLWRVSLATGECVPIPLRLQADAGLPPPTVRSVGREITGLALSPDGKKLAFTAHGELFLDFADKETDRELRSGPAFQVTNNGAREAQPRWLPDSRSLVYTSDRDGEPQLYLYEVSTRQERQLTTGQRANDGPLPSPDGRYVAFVAGMETLCLYELASTTVRELVHGHFPGAQLAWSPDSRWLAYVYEDDRYFANLAVIALDDPQPRQLTFLSNRTAYRPLWAPNGQFLVFSTEHGPEEWTILRVDLRQPAPLLREAEFERLFGEGGDKEKDRERDGQEAPARSSQVERVEIEFAGIERRVRVLISGVRGGNAHAISPDSRDLVFSAAPMGRSQLWLLALDEARQDQPARQLTSVNGARPKSDVQFAPNGRLLYYLDRGQVAHLKLPGGDPHYPPITAEVVVDFATEKWQIFHECWRLLRDAFYDEGFRGVDWAAQREAIRPAIAAAANYTDLAAAIHLMLGELRVSHLGFYRPPPASSGDGYPGLVFDPDALAAGQLRIQAVLPDSPAALAADPPRVGEYLLAVDGVPLRADQPLDRLLRRTVNRRVLLTLGPAPGEPGREAAVRPVDAQTYADIRYRAWVAENSALVTRASGGRLGYIHLRRLYEEDYRRFIADLDAVTYAREGVIIDVRFNTGGYIASFILDILARRNVLLAGRRGRPAVSTWHLHGNRVLGLPTVLVTNEGSRSNAEIFAEAYRRLGLGLVVGCPTAGAVIGTADVTLIDGTRFRIPRVRHLTPEGEELEGNPRPVDIEVPRRLGERMRGMDAQLTAAVAALLAQLGQGSRK